MHQEVCCFKEMSDRNDSELGKREAIATGDAIAEVKAKIQGAAEADSSDSSDGHAGSCFVVIALN